MAIAVLLFLAVLWAAVLIPPVLRSRSDSRRGDSLGRPGLGFGALPRNPLSRNRSDDVSPSMGFRGAGSTRPAPPGRRTRYTPPLVPAAGASTMSPMQRRRRDVLVVLAGVVFVTLVIAFLSGSMALWGVQLLADAALGGYLYLLVQMKQQRGMSARQPVRRPGMPQERVVLPSAPLPPTPTLSPRRIEPNEYRRYDDFDQGSQPYGAFDDHEVDPERHAVSF